jgi:hypothetical protein
MKLPPHLPPNKKNLKTLVSDLEYFSELKENNITNTWTWSVILVSGALWTGEAHDEELAYGKKAAEYYKNTVLPNAPYVRGKRIKTILNATKEDLMNCLFDTKVANIALIGHGSYSSRVAHGWALHIEDTLKARLPHLKKWLFLNAGCAKYQADNFLFPFWAFCVQRRSQLFGMKTGTVGDAYDAAHMHPLAQGHLFCHKKNVLYVEDTHHIVSVKDAIIAMNTLRHYVEINKRYALKDPLLQWLFRIVGTHIARLKNK